LAVSGDGNEKDGEDTNRTAWWAAAHRLQCPAPADAPAYILGDRHGAELRAAHRAEVRGLGAFLRQGGVVEGARGVRVKAQVELVFPAEWARLRPQPRPIGLSPCEILLAG